MTSVAASGPVSSSGSSKRSHQPSKGSSPYLSPSRKAATFNFPPSTETDESNKDTGLDRRDSNVHPRKISSAGIAEEKEELFALLEDIPQLHQSMHPSYTILPWAYKLYLAVDRSEPSEMAKAYGIMSSNSDPVAKESREEKEESPQLEDIVLPSSLSLEERRTIYQMVHSVLACMYISFTLHMYNKSAIHAHTCTLYTHHTAPYVHRH